MADFLDFSTVIEAATVDKTTLSFKQAQTLDVLQQTLNQFCAQAVSAYKRLWLFVWQNIDQTGSVKLSPQQVFDSMGTKGADFLAHMESIRTFTLKNLLGDAASKGQADVLFLPHPAHDVNPDGTVTVK